MALWGKCTFKQYQILLFSQSLSLYITKRLSATQERFYYIRKCAKSALKQSDSVANSTVQGAGKKRLVETQRRPSVRHIYKALRRGMKGLPRGSSRSTLVGSEYRIFW